MNDEYVEQILKNQLAIMNVLYNMYLPTPHNIIVEA